MPANANAGSTITVKVNIGQVTNFCAYQFNLSYKNSVIKLTPEAEGGAGVTQGVISSTAIPIVQWNYKPAGTPGTVTITGGIPPNQAVTGSGYLVELHFVVVGTAGQSSQLVLSSIPGFSNSTSPYCYDSQGDAITVTVQNGSVTVAP